MQERRTLECNLQGCTRSSRQSDAKRRNAALAEKRANPCGYWPRAEIDICDNRRGGFVNHPGPFKQKTELLAYELWPAPGRPWGTREAMGGVEDARHAAGSRGLRDQVHGGAILRFALTASISAVVLWPGLTPQPPPARTDWLPPGHRPISTDFCRHSSFAVKSFSLARGPQSEQQT
jgi:hypothetical protein